MKDTKAARSMLQDPYQSFRFRVQIDGMDVAGFSDVTGLSMETEVETFKEGGNNSTEHMLPGVTKYPARLVLKRGLSDTELWKWYWDVSRGTIERKNVSIHLTRSSGDDEKMWTFGKACPVKWTGPDFKATTGDVAFEAVEFVHQGLMTSDLRGA